MIQKKKIRRISCPYCNNYSKLKIKTPNRVYYNCNCCELIFKDQQSSSTQRILEYRKNYFKKFAVDQMTGGRNNLFETILELIEKYKKPGKLLDIGAGCGFFLKLAQERGWFPRGIDPSEDSVNYAKVYNGINLFNGTLSEYDSSLKFDAITFINVLDHTIEPWREIEHAKRFLKDEGIIFIRSPNGFLHTNLYKMAFNSTLKGYIKNHLVFHEYCFTSNFIKRLISDYGFSNVKVFNSQPSKNATSSGIFNGIYYCLIKAIFYHFTEITRITSFQRCVLGTSLNLIAVK